MRKNPESEHPGQLGEDSVPLVRFLALLGSATLVGNLQGTDECQDAPFPQGLHVLLRYRRMGLVIYGTSMPFVLLNYNVIPYQIGTGEILPDESLNWNTAEALISLTVFVLNASLTLMAMKVIWDRYNPQTRQNQQILQRARLEKNA